MRLVRAASLRCAAELTQAAAMGRRTGPGVGDARGDTENLAYWVSGQRYIFSGHCRIAAHTVRTAARQYLATGELRLRSGGGGRSEGTRTTENAGMDVGEMLNAVNT